MRFQKSGKSWIVHVRRGEFPGAKRHWPAELTVGTIEQGTGKVDVWPAPYGTQGRGGKEPPGWRSTADRLLRDAGTRRGLFGAMKGERRGELATGRIIVRLSTGLRSRFHDSGTAHDWAERKLRRAPNGTYAYFFHDTGAWSEKPYSALHKNEHGVIGHGSIHEWRGSRHRRRHDASPRRWAERAYGVGAPRASGRPNRRARRAAAWVRDPHTGASHWTGGRHVGRKRAGRRHDASRHHPPRGTFGLTVHELGNNETASTGVAHSAHEHSPYLALTRSQSKHFKTLAGAVRWLAARGYDAHGRRLPHGSRHRTRHSPLGYRYWVYFDGAPVAGFTTLVKARRQWLKPGKRRGTWELKDTQEHKVLARMHPHAPGRRR